MANWPRVHENIRMTESQLAAIVEHLTEGVVASHMDGELVYWNPAAVAMHGFDDLEQCLRMLPEFGSIFELETPDREPIDLDDWPLNRILRGEIVLGLEVNVHRIDVGWTRRFSYSGSLIRDEQGQPDIGLVTVRDVTEARQRREELRAALAEKSVLVTELTAALQNVRTLSTLLPMCAWCGRIRNDGGEYERLDAYIARSVGATFTHGMCPDCYEQERARGGLPDLPR